MRRALLLAALLGACGGREYCDSGPIQILPAEPGEDLRYQHLACDGVTPRAVCVLARAVLHCEGDTSPICC